MRKLFEVVKCFSCGASHSIGRTVFKAWRRKYPNVMKFPLECCDNPDGGWPGINLNDRVLLKVE